MIQLPRRGQNEPWTSWMPPIFSPYLRLQLLGRYLCLPALRVWRGGYVQYATTRLRDGDHTVLETNKRDQRASHVLRSHRQAPPQPTIAGVAPGAGKHAACNGRPMTPPIDAASWSHVGRWLAAISESVSYFDVATSCNLSAKSSGLQKGREMAPMAASLPTIWPHRHQRRKSNPEKLGDHSLARAPYATCC